MPLEDRLWRFAREFSELERLRVHVRRAEKILTTVGKPQTGDRKIGRKSAASTVARTYH